MTDPVNPVEPENNPAPAPSVMTPPVTDPVPTTDPVDPPAVTGAPESIDGYQVEVENFNFDEFKAIPENQEFLERAREAGLDNGSLNFLLKEYNELIPALMENNA